MSEKPTRAFLTAPSPTIALLSRLSQPPFIWVAVGLIPLAFLTAGFVRAAPFEDDVSRELSAGDDWLTYKLNALSILADGLSMPAVQGPYRRPGGFLYNYFLAGLFAVLGVNSSFVYVAQSAMLGLSISVMYLAFRGYLGPIGGSIFLVVVSLFMVVDFFRYYSFRLLSENLLIFLLPVLFWLTTWSHERRSLVAAGAAGLVAGLAVLTRPNLVLFGPAVCMLFLAYAPRRSPGRARLPLAFFSIFLVTVSLLPIRNYAVTGRPSLDVITYRGDWMTPSESGASNQDTALRRTVRAVLHYTRRTLFAVGVGPALAPEYRVRVHWLVMWAGFILFAGIAAARRRLEFWQALLMLFVCLYLGPLIAVAMIENYGFRMIVPAVPAVLLLAVNAGEIALQAIAQRRRNPMAEVTP